MIVLAAHFSDDAAPRDPIRPPGVRRTVAIAAHRLALGL